MLAEAAHVGCFSYKLYRLFQTQHSFSDNFYSRLPPFFYSAGNKLVYSQWTRNVNISSTEGGGVCAYEESIH
jgi:hypothetical protein